MYPPQETNHLLQGTIQSHCPELCSWLSEQVWRALPGQCPFLSALPDLTKSSSNRNLWSSEGSSELRKLSPSTGGGPQTDSEVLGHSFFGRFREPHLSGPYCTAERIEKVEKDLVHSGNNEQSHFDLLEPDRNQGQST